MRSLAPLQSECQDYASAELGRQPLIPVYGTVPPYLDNCNEFKNFRGQPVTIQYCHHLQ